MRGQDKARDREIEKKAPRGPPAGDLQLSARICGKSVFAAWIQIEIRISGAEAKRQGSGEISLGRASLLESSGVCLNRPEKE